MASFITNRIKDTMEITDDVIATSMIASASAGAGAYLSAGMTSTTPELRAIYLGNLTQVLGGHSALTELIVKKEWAKPYSAPTEQLLDVYNKSKDRI
ncbi:spore coat protein [Clostridium cylindrosporum]|uniref:Putative spore coat protein, CotF-like protein n=1 Tax=Clostridium cylindrosporum DSM 605 TaxID=1121307 RepID=A0A0J8DCP4_CLOCY|nr:spore coat protein [Clostridium cylindrosporum]KMT22013.1 putative spore coat protein, CotF-like protein [Clostridium cylindrosporum DSM 605]